MADSPFHTDLNWSLLGQGQYNQAYVSNEAIHFHGFFGRIVKKLPINPATPLSQVDRIARKFREIYPDVPLEFEKTDPLVFLISPPPEATHSIQRNEVYLFEQPRGHISIHYKNHKGENITKEINAFLPKDFKPTLLKRVRYHDRLTTEQSSKLTKLLELKTDVIYLPYFGTTMPNDEEIQQEILRIYQETRNIIADGCIQNNFKKIGHRSVCVDLDLAIRRGSITSEIEYFSHRAMKNSFEHFWDTYETNQNVKKSTLLIRTLIYIESHLHPREITNDLLSLEILEKLHYLRLMKHPLTRHDLLLIKKIITANPEMAQDLHCFIPTILEQLRPHQSSEHFSNIIFQVFLNHQPIIELDPSENILSINDDTEIHPSIFSP